MNQLSRDVAHTVKAFWNWRKAIFDGIGILAEQAPLMSYAQHAEKILTWKGGQE